MCVSSGPLLISSSIHCTSPLLLLVLLNQQRLRFGPRIGSVVFRCRHYNSSSYSPPLDSRRSALFLNSHAAKNQKRTHQAANHARRTGIDSTSSQNLKTRRHTKRSTRATSQSNSSPTTKSKNKKKTKTSLYIARLLDIIIIYIYRETQQTDTDENTAALLLHASRYMAKAGQMGG